MPPTAALFQAPEKQPSGLAALAGWDDLEQTVAEIYAARAGSADRPAPDLG